MAGSPKKRAKKDAVAIREQMQAEPDRVSAILAVVEAAGAVHRGAPPPLKSPEARQVVLEWTIAGIEATKIANYLGCTYDQLQWHYKHELDTATDELVGRIGLSVAQRALAGDMKAAEIFLHHRGGEVWRKKSSVEVTGKDGEAITVEVKDKLVDKLLELVANKEAPPLIDVTPKAIDKA